MRISNYEGGRTGEQGFNDIVTRKTKDHLTSNCKTLKVTRGEKVMANYLANPQLASSIASSQSGRYTRNLYSILDFSAS